MAGLLAAGTPDSAAAQEHADDDHHFHHNHVAVVVAAMTPLSESSYTSLALGADYEYRVNERWGVGGGADFTLGDHKRTALFLGAGTYRPLPALRFGTGPGFELVEKDKEGGGTKNTTYFVWAFSVAYDFHIGSISLAPTVILDLVGETKTNLTYGIAVGTGF